MERIHRALHELAAAFSEQAKIDGVTPPIDINLKWYGGLSDPQAQITATATAYSTVGTSDRHDHELNKGMAYYRFNPGPI